METIDALNRIVWYVGSMATVALVIRLLWTGLANTYRAFFALCCVTLLRDLFLAAVKLKGDKYAYFYMATQALVAILYGFVVTEMFGLILKQYPAIRTLSRWVLWGAVFVCVAGACLLFYMEAAEASQTQNRGWLLKLFFAGERSVYGALGAYILLISFFLVWFPVTLSRNIIAHSMLFVCYFIFKALAMFLRGVVDSALYRWVDVGLLAASSVLVVLWALLLKPSGEKANAVVGHQWNPGGEQKLLAQLELINTALARAGHQ